MQTPMRSSAEDYLETILLLSRKPGTVRSIDIVHDMGFSRASVSVAVKKLRDSGMIEIADDGSITLTKEGAAAAEQVYERHLIIREWLASLGVSEAAATKDACMMEHFLSDETFAAIRKAVGTAADVLVENLPEGLLK